MVDLGLCLNPKFCKAFRHVPSTLEYELPHKGLEDFLKINHQILLPCNPTGINAAIAVSRRSEFGSC